MKPWFAWISLCVLIACCGDVDSPGDPDAASPDATDELDAALVDAALVDAPGADAPPPDGVAQVAAGHGVACAVKSSGAVLCWGANNFGQLGVAPATTTTTCSAFGSTAPCRATPAVVAGLSDVASVAVGFYHACAVKRDGTVWCWGLNTDGQLGHDPAGDGMCGTQKCAPTPTQVAGVTGAVEVVTPGWHTCARTTAGAIVCWGLNANGQLGRGTFGASSHVPAFVSGMNSGATRIAAAGFGHTSCALKGGEVYCWGHAYGEGNLGHDPATDPACTSAPCASSPVKVASLTGVFDLAVGERTVCVAVSGGNVRCWGSNLLGQLGISATEPSGYTHRAVPGLSQVVALSGTMAVTCARTQVGGLSCWGQSNAGGIGDGNLGGASCALGPCRPTPTSPTLSTRVEQYSSGGPHLVLDENGAVRVWGTNGFGELGHAPGAGGDATCGNGTCNPTPGVLVIP